MIVLLSYSINLSANDVITSTGELVNRNDSVLISFDDLRLANSKLVELDYEKQVNNNLRNIISNDSIIIKNYKTINDKVNKDCKKYVRQRNIAISSTALFFLTTIIFLLK